MSMLLTRHSIEAEAARKAAMASAEKPVVAAKVEPEAPKEAQKRGRKPANK